MANIHTYQSGFCTHPECMVIQGGRMQVCQFPAYVFLLQVQDKLWLWDTGYADHFFDATTGVYQLYRRITPVTFDPADAIVNQLSHKGIAAEDLCAVILSHFHADHIAGIKDFVNHKHKTTLIASEDGWNKVKPLKGIKALTDGFLPNLIPTEMEKHLRFIEQFEQTSLPAELAPFDKGYLLPDSNGEIILVKLAGHAHGHFGAFVQVGKNTQLMPISTASSQSSQSQISKASLQTASVNDDQKMSQPNSGSKLDTNSGWVLIASDSAWLPENYQQNLMPSVMANLLMSNVGQYQHTLLKLHQFHHHRPDVPIVLSHSLGRVENS